MVEVFIKAPNGEYASPRTSIETIYNPDGTPVLGNILEMIPAAQKGAPDGVATLTTEGRLTPDQAPTVFEVGGSNEQMLINARWDDTNGIVDQKMGYYTPAGKTYYTDEAVSVVGGTLANDTTATYVNGTCGTVTVSGVTRYVKFTDMVRGYTSAAAAYSIDLCKINNSTITLQNNFINYRSRTGAFFKRIMLANQRILKADKPYTLSILARVNATERANLRICNLNYSGIPGMPVTELTLSLDFTVIKNTFTLSADATGFLAEILVMDTAESKVDIDIKGWKLEEGTQSTIARKDANGVWQLIDPPPTRNILAETCKYFYERIGTGTYGRITTMMAFDSRYATGIIPMSSKRATPAISYIKGAVSDLYLSQGTTYIPLTALDVVQWHPDYLIVNATVASGLTPNAMYMMRAKDVAVSFAIDANL